MYTVPQGSPEAGELHLHHVTIGQAYAFAEAESIGAEEMHVDIARTAVRLELEMMMLQVRRAVAHHGFPGMDLFGPDGPAVALDFHFPRHQAEIRIDHQFRADGARA